VTASAEWRREIANCLDDLAQPRCVHVFEDGRDPEEHIMGADPDDHTICMPDEEYTQARDGLREWAGEAGDRIDVLTAAVEQLYDLVHPGGSLLVCVQEPCRGLHRWVPNARGTVLA
jgi:hypothetical protein